LWIQGYWREWVLGNGKKLHRISAINVGRERLDSILPTSGVSFVAGEKWLYTRQLLGRVFALDAYSAAAFVTQGCFSKPVLLGGNLANS